MNLLRKLWAKLWCDHRWQYIDNVQDQDLRSGYKFWSERYRCSKCGRYKTIELLSKPR